MTNTRPADTGIEVVLYPEAPITWNELEALAGDDDPLILVLHVGAEPGVQDGGVWRVQYISCRSDGDRREWLEGRHDFATEAQARAYFDSDEVQSRLSEYWRAEVRYLPGPRTVVSVPFREPTRNAP